MRYRRLDPNGDYSFGRQLSDFHINVPAAPAQAAMTRLMLYEGEWFLDTSDGTKWNTAVLGVNTRSTRDLELKDRVLGTPNVTSIPLYSSTTDPNARAFTAAMTIETTYGVASATVSGGPSPTFTIGT
jgi:hypothetical protein